MRVLTVDGRDYVCREQYENIADELALTAWWWISWRRVRVSARSLPREVLLRRYAVAAVK